jgi:hypothetical protein
MQYEDTAPLVPSPPLALPKILDEDRDSGERVRVRGKC